MSKKLSKKELQALHSIDYVNKFIDNQPISRLERLMSEIELDKNMVVLDVGCGSGMLASIISPQVKTYFGIDFSIDFIKAAKANNVYSNVKFLCEDINTHCQNNVDKYDAIFAMDISEHIYDKEWLKILKSLKLALKSEGSLYLHTPNADFFIEKMKEHNFILKQFPEHIAVRDMKSNISIINDAGFLTLVNKTIPHYNVLKYLDCLKHVPLLGKYFEARIFIRAKPN